MKCTPQPTVRPVAHSHERAHLRRYTRKRGALSQRRRCANVGGRGARGGLGAWLAALRPPLSADLGPLLLQAQAAAAPSPPPAAASPPPPSEAPWDGISLARWPDLAQAAELQLGEAKARVAAAVPALREMLLKLPEQQRPRDLTDAALLRGLRARKFRVDFTCVRSDAHCPHGP